MVIFTTDGVTTQKAKLKQNIQRREAEAIIEEMFAMNPPVYILTNKGKYRGASAFLNKKALREICNKNNTTKLVAIPSSIHEFLIQPYDESLGISIDEFSKMVMEVNTLTVDPVDQLASRAFIINKEDL